jgi:hypothetical protein
LALSLGFAEARTAIPNCVVGLQQDGDLPVPLALASTQSVRGISFVPAAPLEPNSRYTVTYVCGGS